MTDELRQKVIAYNRRKKAVEAERDALAAKVNAITARVDEIRAHKLYRLLPDWVRGLLDNIIEGGES